MSEPTPGTLVARAAGIIDRSQRGILDLSGKDVVAVMNRVFSSAVTALTPARGQLSTLLSAKGRLIVGFQLFLLEDGALRLVFLEPLRDSAVKALQKYTFLSDIAIADRSSELTIISVEGVRAAEVVKSATGLSALPSAFLELTRAKIGAARVTLVRGGESPEGGWEIWTPVGSLEPVRAALLSGARAVGGGECSPAEAESLRIEAGIARSGADYDDENFPNDAGWDTALTYDKCYVGQEIVARMRTYGQANRRLSGVLFPPGAAVAPPLALRIGDEETGRVTSMAHSARLGRTVGLGMVKRKHWSAKVGVVIAPGGPMEVEIIELPIVRLDATDRT